MKLGSKNEVVRVSTNDLNSDWCELGFAYFPDADWNREWQND